MLADDRWSSKMRWRCRQFLRQFPSRTGHTHTHTHATVEYNCVCSELGWALFTSGIDHQMSPYIFLRITVKCDASWYLYRGVPPICRTSNLFTKIIDRVRIPEKRVVTWHIYELFTWHMNCSASESYWANTHVITWPLMFRHQLNFPTFL